MDVSGLNEILKKTPISSMMPAIYLIVTTALTAIDDVDGTSICLASELDQVIEEGVREAYGLIEGEDGLDDPYTDEHRDMHWRITEIYSECILYLRRMMILAGVPACQGTSIYEYKSHHGDALVLIKSGADEINDNCF